MKITLLIGSLAGGGAERVVCNLANYLADKGHEITILTVSDKQTYKINDNVRHVVLYGESDSKLPHQIINIIRLYRMNRYFRKENVDVYLTFLPKLSSFILAQKRFIKCPVILAERADPNTFCNSSEKNKKIFEKYYPKADGYIFQTEDAKKYYKEHGINVENSVVIPNAINPEFIRPLYQGKRRKVIVGAGRLTMQKNFSLLINSFAEICNDFPEYKLEIYGEGPLKESLINETKNLGIREKVIFKGYVNNLGDCIQDTSLFVLSSDFEGIPNALMEAMALGLPVISTDCPAGGSKVLIENKINGVLVPIKDIEALKKEIANMLTDSSMRNYMGENARKICVQLESKKIYNEWENILKKWG